MKEVKTFTDKKTVDDKAVEVGEYFFASALPPSKSNR